MDWFWDWWTLLLGFGIGVLYNEVVSRLHSRWVIRNAKMLIDSLADGQTNTGDANDEP